MPRIALFDSGIGGLSVLQGIKQHIAHADIVYFADHQFSPYGDKDPTWLNAHIISLVSALDYNHALDAIIIACNTASTLCLDQLRACINTPIIGVVPAVKTAASFTKKRAIGVLATPTTVISDYLQSLITRFAHDCHVTKVSSTELVFMAEQKLNKQTIDQKRLANIIEPFVHAECDYVVLGCTHFPHLKKELNALVPQIHWIDSTHAIAKRCIDVLPKVQPPMDCAIDCDAIFYSSAQIKQGLHKTLKELGFTEINSATQFV